MSESESDTAERLSLSHEILCHPHLSTRKLLIAYKA